MVLGTLVQTPNTVLMADRLITHTLPSYYENSNVSAIGQYVFSGNANLLSISLPNVTYIDWGAFTGCASMKSVNMPNISYLAGCAFDNCKVLNTVTWDWTKISYIGQQAFRSCSALPSTINCQLCSFAGEQTFSACQKIQSAYFPNAFSISSNAFNGCLSLIDVSIPYAYTLQTSAFYNCQKLPSITIPRYSTMQSRLFEQCYALSIVTMNWTTAGQMSAQTFSKCYNLLSLYLLGPTMITLANVNAFTSTPISNYTTSTGGVYGSIYVPESLYSSYTTATNWLTYANRFVSMTSSEISSMIGSWTLSLSATFTYPQSRPVYVSDDMKSYISNVIATHYDSTTVNLGSDFYVTGTKEWGGRLVTVIGGGGRVNVPATMVREVELPEGYTQVGYIQQPSDTFPYINTGVYPLSADTFIIVAQTNSTRNNGQDYIIYNNNCGIRRNANLWELYTNGTRTSYTYLSTYGNGGGATITTNVTDAFTTYPYATTRVAISSTTAITPSSYPYFVFAQNNNGTPFKNESLGFRIWYTEIPNRLKLIPCIRNSDNTVGMYDLMGNICSLTNTPFFINAGTGSFTYGYNPL